MIVQLQHFLCGVVDNPGILSGHPDMPEFVFDGEDVGAIIAYLKVIQE